MDVHKLCDEIKPHFDTYKNDKYVEMEFRLGKFNGTFLIQTLVKMHSINSKKVLRYIPVGKKWFIHRVKFTIVIIIIID